MSGTVFSAELAAVWGATRDVLARWPLSAEEEALWRSQARCRGTDPELFYPGRGESQEAARSVCRQCAVRPECLATALANGEKFGTWGGISEKERRTLRRQLAVGSEGVRRRTTPQRIPA